MCDALLPPALWGMPWSPPANLQQHSPAPLHSCSQVLRQYKPAAFLKAQQAARAAAAAAGTPAADPTPLRTLRLGRLLEEVQVGAAAFGASWWCCNMAKIESLVAPKHAAVAALEVGTRSSPAPAPNTHRHHPALRCPPPQVLRDCKHFIKVGSGERFGVLPTPPGMLRLLCHLALPDVPREDDSGEG